MCRVSRRLISLCLALNLTCISVVHAQVDGAQVLKGLGVSPDEVAQLEDGGILTFSDEAYESTKRELAADAMVLIQIDLETVVKLLVEEPTIIPTNKVLDHSEINSAADFAGIVYTDAEIDEVRDLIRAEPGKKYNFSNSEYALLQEKLAPYARSDAASQIAAASEVMREILIGRYDHYRENGLEGIEGYVRSGKKSIDIGRELRLTTETFKPFDDDFPKFYKVMHDFPAGSECCDHYYRWLKVKVGKRPLFALAHTMIESTDDYVLMTERYYFASSTLNSLQVTLSWLKYDHDTYMGLAMSASTDILDSVMGRMLRPIGRNKAKDLVEEVLLDVRSELASDDETEGE